MSSAFLAAAFAVAGYTSLQAQSVPASGEITRLNPFEIIESQDDTFRAMSVGSGSRLRLELKDTPVSYSVINRAFIDALGINSLVEAAAWATGQTFFAIDNGGDANGRPSQYFTRGNLNTQGGADSFGSQRNFYQNTNQGGDSYAVESFDFGRGPNAALFGQGGGSDGAQSGGLGGVSSMQTKRARFDNARTSISLEVGSWDYRRGSIDINRPLTDRIGIRINAVDMDRKAYRERDMQTSRGLTFTTTFRLTDSTELRLEASTDRSTSHTTGGGWDEQLTGWDGKTSFRGPITNSMLSANATPGANNVANASYGPLAVLGLGSGTSEGSASGLTWNGETNGIKRNTGASYLYNPYTGTVMNYQNSGLSARADNTTRTPLWTKTAPNGAYFVRSTMGTPTPASFSIGRSFHVKDGIPSDVWDRASQNSRFRVPDRRYTATIDSPSTGQRTKDINMAITQTWGNFAFELGGDVNKGVQYINSFDNPNGNNGIGGGRSMVIDLNTLLPDGSPNPGYLDWVNTFGYGYRDETTQDSTIRLNMGYTANWGAFGNYVFNVQASRSERKFHREDYALSLKLNADSRRWQNDTVSSVLWGSDNVRAWKEPTNGTGVRFTDVDWTNPNSPVIVPARTIFPDFVMSTYNKQRTETRYLLAQTTARWFNEKVVFTGALRRDNSKGQTWSAIAQGDRPAGWTGQMIFRPDAPQDYFTMTYIELNNATGLPLTGKPRLSGNRPRTTDATTGLNIPDPRYAAERFRDDYNAPKRNAYGTTHSAGLVWHATNWISPYVNYSNTYTPQSSTSLDLNGDVRDPTTAYGYDFGGNFRILGERITAKYNYYVQVRENDNFNPAPSANINALYASNHFSDPDTTATGRNARGAQDLPGGDYQNQKNQGYELEISVENVVPGLRITANGSYGWRSVSDRGPLIRQYVPANANLFKQILEDAGGMLDTTQRPSNAPNAPGLAVVNPAITGGIDTTNAINSYNNLWNNFETLDSGRILRIPTQPQMNIVVDYTLQRGRLSGLGMSAGLQWQGRVALGNKGGYTIINPNNPLVAIDDPAWDGNDLRQMKGDYNSQVNFRYTHRLASGNALQFALRVNNPLNYVRDPVGDAAGPGNAGTGFGGTLRQPEANLTKPNRVLSPDLVARFVEPINFRLTTTYTFGGGRSSR